MPTAYGKYSQHLNPSVSPLARGVPGGGGAGQQVAASVKDEFTVVAGQPGAAAADVIIVGTIEPGAEVVGGYVRSTGLGTTVDVGIVGVAANMFAAAAADNLATALTGLGYRPPATVQVGVTLTGAATAGGKVEVRLLTTQA